jgi:hypothetical protein
MRSASLESLPEGDELVALVAGRREAYWIALRLRWRWTIAWRWLEHGCHEGKKQNRQRPLPLTHRRPPSLTRARYEEVVRRLTGKSHLESPVDLPFEGLLMHVAGEGKDGFCIVDVFESEEAVRGFNEAMGSIPREAGIKQPPEFFPVHTFISDRR